MIACGHCTTTGRQDDKREIDGPAERMVHSASMRKNARLIMQNYLFAALLAGFGCALASRALAYIPDELLKRKAQPTAVLSEADKKKNQALEHYMQGKSLQIQWRYEEAIHEYQTALDIDPGFEKANKALLLAQFELDRVKKSGQEKKPVATAFKKPLKVARDVPEQAFEPRPSSEGSAQRVITSQIKGKSRPEPTPPNNRQSQQQALQSHYLTGSQALDNGDYATAVKEFQLILEFSPDHKEAKYKLSIAQTRRNDEMETLKRKAAEARAKGDTFGELNAMTQYANLDPQNVEARQALEQTKQANIRSVDELYRKGVNEYVQGRYAEALKVWKMVLVLEPKHSKALESTRKVKEKLNLIAPNP